MASEELNHDEHPVDRMVRDGCDDLPAVDDGYGGTRRRLRLGTALRQN
jgi:hypothetical protein